MYHRSEVPSQKQQIKETTSYVVFFNPEAHLADLIYMCLWYNTKGFNTILSWLCLQLYIYLPQENLPPMTRVLDLLSSDA